jgi:hypothetical protein
VDAMGAGIKRAINLGGCWVCCNLLVK